FRTSPSALVVVYDKRVEFQAFVQVLSAALERHCSPPASSRPGTLVRVGSATRRVLAVQNRLRGLAFARTFLPAAGSPREVVGPWAGNFRFRAAGELKAVRGEPSEGQRVERADLHALLATGDFTLEADSLRLGSSRSQLFLDAERLLQAAEQVL